MSTVTKEEMLELTKEELIEIIIRMQGEIRLISRAQRKIDKSKESMFLDSSHIIKFLSEEATAFNKKLKEALAVNKKLGEQK